MQANCSFYIKTKDLQKLTFLKKLFEQIINVTDRIYFDDVTCIDENDGSFTVDMENGMGVNVLEYVIAADYLLKKNNISDISFEIRGVDDMDFNTYNAFIMNYDNGIIGIRETRFGIPEDRMKDDDEIFDNDDDFFTGDECDDLLKKANAYWDKEEQVFEELEKETPVNDLNKHGLAGEIEPINEKLLDSITIE